MGWMQELLVGGLAAGLLSAAMAPAPSRWVRQDLSRGYGMLRLGDETTVARFGAGAWGYVNGADFDGDGDIDLVVCSGVGGGARNTYAGLYVYTNVGTKHEGLLDTGQKLAPIEMLDTQHLTPYVGDADGDGRPDVWCSGWLCLNESADGRIRFAKPVKAPKPKWPEPGACDWNRDGFVDEFVYDRWRLRLVDGRTGKAENLRVGDSDLLEDLFIRPFVCDWDGDGDLDFLIGQESGHITFIENQDGVLMPERHVLQRDPNVKSGCSSVPVACDWFGDGGMDLVVGTAAGFVELYEHKDGAFLPPARLEAGGQTLRIMAGELGSMQGAGEARWGETNPWVADWDLDGDLDLLLGCNTGEILLCENVGTRTAPKLAAPTKLKVDWGDRKPVYPEGLRYTPEPGVLVVQWRSRPVVYDWNRDGLPDLISIDESGYLALYPRYRRADGTLGLRPAEHPFVGEDGKPLLWCTNPRPGRNGRMVFDIADWLGDGKPHIIRNAGTRDGRKNMDFTSCFVFLECLRVEPGPRAIYRWRGEMVPPRILGLQGHNSAPFVMDIDGDGRLDLISGCEDGNVYFFTRDFLDRVGGTQARAR